MKSKSLIVKGLFLITVLIFAVKTLLLIDKTGLWSDELYSVGKSFNSTPIEMIEILRQDTHPPMYYGILWLWGKLFGQSPITLRLLSWLAYLGGAILVSIQAINYAKKYHINTSLALYWSASLMLCSPFPVRFSIEGKGYALLVLFISLAWWARCIGRYKLYY